MALTGFPLLAVMTVGITLMVLGFILMRASMIRRAEAHGGSVSLWQSPSSSLWTEVR
ncbi:MAG: hypothetical protein M3N98_03560 [Actinomycetota bacterium]|nr:hypothetical protein [Actinomycetota bacterium]